MHSLQEVDGLHDRGPQEHQWRLPANRALRDSRVVGQVMPRVYRIGDIKAGPVFRKQARPDRSRSTSAGPPRSPPGMVRLQPFGNTGHGPALRRRGNGSEQETGSPNDPGMIDDFRLWGSSRCRQMDRHLTDGGWRSNMAAILLRTTPFSQRATPSPLWGGLP